MPLNPAVFGASIWGGATQTTSNLLSNSMKEELVDSVLWYAPMAPILAAPVTSEETVSGYGVVGVTVEDGLWIAEDSSGNTKVIKVESGKTTIVNMASTTPAFAAGETKSIGITDADMVSASAGGEIVPKLCGVSADNDGYCELNGLPSGNLLVVKYLSTSSHNLWFVSYDETQAHEISLTLTKAPTENPLASNSSDVTVTVLGEEVTVESVDAVSGLITLASAPAAIPVCTYWTIVGEEYG